MNLTREPVDYVSRLARLALQPAELAQSTQPLVKVLPHMDVLNGLDTEGIEPTSHAIPIPCVMRADEVRPSFDTRASLQNAPGGRGLLSRVRPV